MLKQDVSNTLWALASLGHRDDALLAAATPACLRLLHDMSHQHLANVAWSLGRLGYRDAELLQAICNKVEGGCSRFGIARQFLLAITLHTFNLSYAKWPVFHMSR